MKRPQGPVPTLGQLQESIEWFWLHCERCQHSALRALYGVRPQGRDAAASGLGR